MQSTIRRIVTVFTLVLLAAAPLVAQDKKKDPFERIEDDPKLPRILLIGDSISIGYHLDVRDLLKGKANVHRPATNCGPTTNGLKNLDAWLKTAGAGKKWDVIHFNFGLHDLKYMDDKGVLSDVAKGKQQVEIKQYEKNLRELVAKLKKSGAKLIWCATTPVPQGAKGRVPGDVAKYNEAAENVMKDESVAINDLYSFALPKLKEIQKAKDVHYTDAGSKVLAEEVTRHIAAALKKE